MAQGKEWTVEERDEIVQSLKPYLEMGFSRNKACSFIGLAPATLSNWTKENPSLGIKLVSYENVNSALALANIHQAIKNEGVKATEGDTKVENSWKLVSKLEDQYKDKIDVTSGDKPLPTPILGVLHDVPSDNSNT